MRKHKIEVGDLIEHGVTHMNEDVSFPAIYKITCISSGTDGFKLTFREPIDLGEYQEWMTFGSRICAMRDNSKGCQNDGRCDECWRISHEIKRDPYPLFKEVV